MIKSERLPPAIIFNGSRRFRFAQFTKVSHLLAMAKIK